MPAGREQDGAPLTLFAPDDFPAYSIRESARARTVRLHMTPGEGLVIVIPSGYDRRRIPAIVAEKSSWIARAADWASRQRRLKGVSKPPSIPDVIALRAVGETWDVQLRETAAARATAREHANGRLVLSAPAGDVTAGLGALSRWTRSKAREHLVPWLAELGDETGLEFTATKIGNQRSLWASCSPSGTISLNQKLMFMPERLVRYVLVHELCHLAHMNHSKRFWSRVRRHEPRCLELRRELGDSWHLVPSWLDI